MVTMATYDHGMVVILYLVHDVPVNEGMMWMVLAHHLHDGLYGYRGFGCTLSNACRHAHTHP